MCAVGRGPAFHTLLIHMSKATQSLPRHALRPDRTRPPVTLAPHEASFLPFLALSAQASHSKIEGRCYRYGKHASEHAIPALRLRHQGTDYLRPAIYNIQIGFPWNLTTNANTLRCSLLYLTMAWARRAHIQRRQGQHG